MAQQTVVAMDRDSMLVTLNCAEADLLGVLEDGMVSSADPNAPMAATVRDLHRLIKIIDHAHTCAVDKVRRARKKHAG